MCRGFTATAPQRRLYRPLAPQAAAGRRTLPLVPPMSPPIRRHPPRPASHDPLQLHRSSRGGETLTEQIVNGVAALIERRALRAGAALPSVRRFAMQHGVSTFTVAEAYARLTALGYLSARAPAPATVAHRHARQDWRRHRTGRPRN